MQRFRKNCGGIRIQKHRIRRGYRAFLPGSVAVTIDQQQGNGRKLIGHLHSPAGELHLAAILRIGTRQIILRLRNTFQKGGLFPGRHTGM